MSTFESQVEALTKLTLTDSSTPTRNELTDFLTQGAKDIINRIISANPEKAKEFTATSQDTDNSGIKINGEIVTVVREHDSTSILRPCVNIDASQRYEATDTESLSYRSKYNPGFYFLNNKVFIVPVPSSDNNGIVTQVTYPEISYSASSWNYPKKYEYLIVYYASMLSLLSKAGSLHTDSNLTSSMDLINSSVDSSLERLIDARSITMEVTGIFSDISSKVSSSNASIAKMTAEIELANAQADLATSQIELADSSFDKLIFEIDKAINDLSNSQTYITNALSEVSLMNPQIDEAKDTIVNLKNDIDISKSRLEESKTELSNNTSLLSTTSTLVGNSSTWLSSGDGNKLDTIYNRINGHLGEIESKGFPVKTEAAFDKAQKLFSDDAGFSALSDVTDDLSNSTSVTGWLEEEDPEMVTTTINSIASELKRGEAELNKWVAECKTISERNVFNKGKTDNIVSHFKLKTDNAINYANLIKTYSEQAINLGKNSEGYMNTAKAYQGAIESYISIARGYGEVNDKYLKLSDQYQKNAGQHLNVAQAHGASGQGYLATGDAYLKNTNSYLSTSKSYGDEGDKHLNVASNHMQKIDKKISQADSLIKSGQLYTQSADGYTKEATSRIQYLQQEYSWYMSIYSQIKSKYDEAFFSEEQIAKRNQALKEAFSKSAKRR